MIARRALTAMCGLLLAAATCAEGAEVTFREEGGDGYIDLTWDVVSINPPEDVAEPDYTSVAIRVSGNPCPPRRVWGEDWTAAGPVR